MHKSKKPVTIITKYVAEYSSTVAADVALKFLIPTAALSPYARVVVPIGRFFIAQTVGRKSAENAVLLVNDAYETYDSLMNKP